MMTTMKRPGYAPGERRNGPDYLPAPRPAPATAAERETALEERAMTRIAEHGPAMIALIAKTKAFKAKWGDCVSDHWIFNRVGARTDFLWEWEADRVREAMRRTEDRAAVRAEKLKTTPYTPAGDSDLSDGQVVAAIRLLTIRDADRAQHANSEGWSASDSSAGHYCYAMLSQDRAVAIALARTLVGKYRRQLATGGII